MIGKVGRYGIVREIGGRGERTLWLADDATLGRRVRLEAVSVADPQAEVLRARFTREAQVASQMHHGCIATVYDAGTADGFHYIARQLLQGETVRQRIARREPIETTWPLQVAADIASALEALHERGLVHGEVDAETVHVLDDGRGLLDGFGLASTSNEAATTPEGDLRGLGNVLASMRSQATVVSADLDRLIQMLQAGRVTTAALLSEELRRIHGASRASSDEPSDSTIAVALQSDRTGSRIRTRIVAGAALLFVLCVCVTYFLGRSKTTVPSVAMLPLVATRPDSTGVDPLMDGIGESVVTKLSQVAGVRVSPWMTVQRYADTDRPLIELARELGVEQLVVGYFDGVGDSVRVTVQLVDGGTGEEHWQAEYIGLRAGVLELQRDLAVDVARELRVRLTAEQRRAMRRTAARNPEAWELYLSGSAALQGETYLDNQRARECYERALELDPDLAEAYVGLGAVQTQAHWRQWEPEESSLQDAEANFRRALRLDARSAAARRGLIRIHFQRGEDEECLKIGQEVERLGLEDVENLLVRGDAFQFGALPEEGAEMYRRVLALDPANEAALAMLVLVLHVCNRFEEAIETGEMFDERFGATYEVLKFMGMSSMCLRDWEGARRYYERAHKISPTYGVDLWTIYLRLGEPAKAHQFLIESVGAFEGLMREQPTSMHALWGLGEVLVCLGDSVRVRDCERRIARFNMSSPIAFVFRGSLEAGLGRIEAGLAHWREAVRLNHVLQFTGSYGDYRDHHYLREVPAFQELMAEVARIKARRRAQYGAGIVAEAPHAANP